VLFDFIRFTVRFTVNLWKRKTVTRYLVIVLMVAIQILDALAADDWLDWIASGGWLCVVGLTLG
jgi:hypothetical protein